MGQDTITYSFITKFGVRLLVVCSILALNSCRVDKYLADQDKLLVKNKIEVSSPEKIENKVLLKTELTSLLRQEPNGNLLGIPKEWIYLKNADPGDSSWFNNWARDKVGQPPVIHDSLLMYESSVSMQKYLRNKKGFYNAEVQPNVDLDKHKAKVTYDIQTNDRYYIDSIFYIGRDQNILNLIEGMRDKSLVTQGDPADAALFDLEKNRIVVSLQNMGYADFVGNYIEIQGDSTNGNNTIDIFMNIISPLPDTVHRKYRVGNINVFTDFYKGQLQRNTDTSMFNGKIYHHELSKFLVRPSTIDKSIYLEEGTLLTRTNRTRTFRKLSDLNTYRFVTMNPVINPARPQTIDYNIYLTPYQKKWILDTGTDVYYSNFTQRERQLIGVGANGSLSNRNLLGGAERYKISAEGGIEINPIDLLINRYNFSIDNSLQIPKVIDYSGVFRFLNLTKLMSDRRADKFSKEAKTNFKLGYNKLGVIDFYSVQNFNVAAQYQYRLSNTSQVNVTTTGFGLNDFFIGDNFDEIVGPNPLIRNSFTDNLVTGYFFNNLSYLYNSEVNSRGVTWALITDFEVSGWETYLSNKLYNLVSGTEQQWKFLDRYEFSKFAKIELDLRRYKSFNKRNQIASRLNVGIGAPFGSSETLPFIKQFSVGGPNSLRAWDQKELGPGSHSELLENPVIINGVPQLFYQQGDIKIEFNLEYRFDLFWILEGALFTDVGNVWTIEQDERNGQFHSQFYKDLAIAAGWGLRFDFVYFNIRFDFGYRVRNPYPDEETGSHWNQDIFTPSKLGNLQVAVNYPF